MGRTPPTGAASAFAPFALFWSTAVPGRFAPLPLTVVAVLEEAPPAISPRVDPPGSPRENPKSIASIPTCAYRKPSLMTHISRHANTSASSAGVFRLSLI